MDPKDFFFTKEHEWAAIEDNIATIGITDHAQESLGEITFVELPNVGNEVKQGEELAVVESSKAASDVYSPVSGIILEVNTDLESQPELVNQSCYEEGWICKIKVSDKSKTETLIDFEAYEEYLKETD